MYSYVFLNLGVKSHMFAVDTLTVSIAIWLAEKDIV